MSLFLQGLLWAVALTKYIGSLLSEENSHMLDAPEGFVSCYSGYSNNLSARYSFIK